MSKYRNRIKTLQEEVETVNGTIRQMELQRDDKFMSVDRINSTRDDSKKSRS